MSTKNQESAVTVLELSDDNQLRLGSAAILEFLAALTGAWRISAN